MLELVIHRLAGTAGSFGYRELSKLAREIDERLLRDKPAEAQHWTSLKKALAAISLPSDR